MAVNPWHVKSLEEFTFICCPECIYKSKDAVSFEYHALENHPDSTDFFHIDTVRVVLTKISSFKQASALEKAFSLSVNELKKDTTEEEIIKNECQENEEITDNTTNENIFLGEDNVNNASGDEISLPDNDTDVTEIDKLNENFCRDKSQDLMPNQKLPSKSQKKPKSSKQKKQISLCYRQCLVCMKDCGGKSERTKHIQEEHSTKITCYECGVEFENHQKLAKHFHSRHRSVTCNQCGKVYANNQVLTKHVKNVHSNHDEKNFKCDECPYKTHAKLNLYQHKLQTHKRKLTSSWRSLTNDAYDWIACSECHKKVRAKSYVGHYKKMHGSILPPHINGSEKHVCEFCSAEFQLQPNLKKHINKHHNNVKKPDKKIIICELCNTEFLRMSGYVSHYRTFHNCLPPEYQDRPKFYCDQCGKAYVSKLNLNNHVKYSHTKELVRSKQRVEVRNCEHCQKSFKDRNSYVEHVKVIHEKIFNYECSDCAEKFYVPCLYKRHMEKLHKRLACNICKEGPFNKFDMIKHKLHAHKIKPEAQLPIVGMPEYD